MKTTQTIEQITCDICGCAINTELYPSEQFTSVIVGIKISIYYGPQRKLSDFCISCNQKLINVINNKKIVDNVGKLIEVE